MYDNEHTEKCRLILTNDVCNGGTPASTGKVFVSFNSIILNGDMLTMGMPCLHIAFLRISGKELT